MKIETSLWQNGKEKALTFSYDDGRIEDVFVTETFNRYGLKGTFHLCNPGFLSAHGYPEYPIVAAEDFKKVYEGHEISCHMENHPFPARIPIPAVRDEILNNRMFLEKYCGYPVRGMSYPFGEYSDDVVSMCRACGMEYSRTVDSTFGFGIPADFMKWKATCHHSEVTDEIMNKFLASDYFEKLRLFYIWGHSYEFDSEKKRAHLVHICETLSGKDDVWYCTNIEIVDYLNALRSLVFSADMTIVFNPSAISVFIKVNNEPVEIPAGKTVQLNI